MIEGMIMRIFVFFISALLSFNLAAEECKFSFNESELISSIGIAPVKQEIIKDEGITKRQYEFRRELSSEEMLSDDADEKYEPQFYISVYNPSCPQKIIVWFFKDNKNTMDLSNEVLAGRAFKYLTGVNESIFENKMKKFLKVQSFESFDERTDSKFIKSGGIYSIDVQLR